MMDASRLAGYPRSPSPPSGTPAEASRRSLSPSAARAPASGSITSRAVLAFLVCQWIEAGLASVPIAGDCAGLGVSRPFAPFCLMGLIHGWPDSLFLLVLLPADEGQL